MTRTGAGLDARALMEVQVGVLFRHDGQGRISVVNEPPYAPAPRLFVGLVRGGAVVRWRDEGEREAAEAVARVLRRDEPGLAEVTRAAGASGEVWVGPAFVFDRVPDAPARVVAIDEESAGVLARHFPVTRREWRAHAPCLARVEGGVAVAVCMSARQDGRAAEASLHTAEGYRGRGHGLAVARAWARAVAAGGRLALYSTSAHNLASQAVARSLGLRMYGIDVHFG